MESPRNSSDAKVSEVTSDSDYFDSYGHYGIHSMMLQDVKRTYTYWSAITGNKHLFRGKVVLDVGCGTGILCMFAAQAGATKVIGIECSNIIDYARKIIVENNLEDVITLVKGKVEEVSLPEGTENVDIIVSEWMGQALFYESMLNTVIFARDKWLKAGGLIFPDRAALYVAGIESVEFLKDRVNFWKDVYGFKMETLRKWSISEAFIEEVIQTSVVTNSCLVKNVDMYRVKEEDLAFTSSFHLQNQKDGLIHALVLFFEVEFTACFTRTGFSTSPHTLPTHWQQSTLYFEDKELDVKKGEEMFGDLRIEPSKLNKRHLDLEVNINFEGTLSAMDEKMNFTMRV